MPPNSSKNVDPSQEPITLPLSVTERIKELGLQVGHLAVSGVSYLLTRMVKTHAVHREAFQAEPKFPEEQQPPKSGE